MEILSVGSGEAGVGCLGIRWAITAESAGTASDALLILLLLLVILSLMPLLAQTLFLYSFL